ncbi:MAG: DUF1553 domain-containing protein [Planctomycetes bacterium]|nr:DUF1553 domain-containing protein [Planctomycetota bacterium]
MGSSFLIERLTALLAATAVSTPAPAPATDVDFERDIAPIFAERCLKCHAGEKAKSGLRLDVRKKAMRGGNSGLAAIVPGAAEQSRLIELVRGKDAGEVMPPRGTRLTEAEIATLEQWIAGGATWPDAFAGEELVREHWSFLPPTKSTLPVVVRGGWPTSAIDHFTLAAMEQNGLVPAPTADRAALARRVALDLVGLPPTAEQVAAFVADESPHAYARWVRHLLDDPHFGERWARPWLDIARYADSAGYGSDPLRPDLWPWRDWVIDALNRNLPFDQFTIEQLAGDLLPDAADENQRVERQLATAFHRNTMTNTEGGTDDEEFRVAAVKDRVDTTMAAWMGLTFGCAKCHSHKFDPISQRDYYSLFAFFNQTEDADRADEEPRIAAPSAGQRREREAFALRAKDLAVRTAAARASMPETRFAAVPTTGARSQGAATLAIGGDGSVRASGASPATDRYDVEGSAIGFATLRLALLTDSSLPGGGPGRSPGNGNFVLNEVRLHAKPAASGARRSPRARFVRIELPGRARILSLAEVELLRSNGENVARTGHATQSSVDYGGPAQLAIDGNTDGRFESGTTTHTRAEDDPWWELDLGAEHEFDRLVVWNRTGNGLEQRLAGAIVTLFALQQDGARAITWQGRLRDAPAPSTEVDLAGWRELVFASASADFEQPGFPAAAAIDGSSARESGFAIGGQQGRAHALELVLRAPFDGALEWRLEIDQTWGDAHTLGAFRVEGCATPPPRELLELAEAERSLAAEQAALEAAIVRVPVLREVEPEKRRATHVLTKSNYLQPGDEVAAATPREFPSLPADAPRDRLALARWLVARDNPLTARVAVNRFWAQLFARGLVETEEDFGTQGTPPSHPELLDWLAVTFMDDGWDVKELLFRIVTSATYRQSARGGEVARARDPENRWLSWFPRRRLEAEQLRDQALALAGLLTPTIGGPSVYPPQPDGLWQAAFNGERNYPTSAGPERWRRGLYSFWRRTVPPPAMQTFDAPSRESCTLRRSETNTPLQAFVTLNDPSFVEAAQALARRIVQEGGSRFDERLDWSWRLALFRSPRADERSTIRGLFESERARLFADPAAARALCEQPLGALPEGLDAAEVGAWVVVANVLLNLDALLVRG